MLSSTVITRNIVVLRYARLGEKGYTPRASYLPPEGDIFVRLDYHSGGYPSATVIHDAHDFKTVEEARRYVGHFENFTICEVQVTYNVKDIEHV